jgi:hypothetical protein
MMVVTVIQYTKTETWPWALSTGLLLTLATMVRPISYYLILPVIVWFAAWGVRRRLRFRLVAVHLCLILVPYASAIGGWQVRNYHLTGSAMFSHIEGENIFYYRGAAIMALRDGVNIEEVWRALKAQAPEREGSSPPSDYPNVRMKDQGLALIRAHPFLFMRAELAGAATLLAGPGVTPLLLLLGIEGDREALRHFQGRSLVDYARKWVLQSPAVALAFLGATLYLVVLYGGCLLWLVRGSKSAQPWLLHALLWGVVLYFIVISGGPEANARFRVPIMPILSLYAAAGWARVVYRDR